jgi:hypothetical protein
VCGFQFLRCRTLTYLDESSKRPGDRETEFRALVLSSGKKILQCSQAFSSREFVHLSILCLNCVPMISPRIIEVLFKIERPHLLSVPRSSSEKDGELLQQPSSRQKMSGKIQNSTNCRIRTSTSSKGLNNRNRNCE